MREWTQVPPSRRGVPRVAPIPVRRCACLTSPNRRAVARAQLFNKGARYLKLDPHWMPPSFCKTQTGLRNPQDPRGCMVLNHDNPTPTRTDYNTTDQIVDVLSSGAFQRTVALGVALPPAWRHADRSRLLVR